LLGGRPAVGPASEPGTAPTEDGGLEVERPVVEKTQIDARSERIRAETTARFRRGCRGRLGPRGAPGGTPGGTRFASAAAPLAAESWESIAARLLAICGDDDSGFAETSYSNRKSFSR
jgi:hypothetical protein